MLLVILTETKRSGVVPRGHLCSGWWSGLPWAGPHRGTGEWAADVQVVPLPLSCPPAPHQVWAPSDVHHGKVREVPAQSELWGDSGTFESSARGGVGRDRRPPASVRQAGRPEVSLFPLNHGSVRLGRLKERQPGFAKLRGAPGGGCFWNPERLFGWSWQSRRRADVNTGGVASRAKAAQVCQVGAVGATPGALPRAQQGRAKGARR